MTNKTETTARADAAPPIEFINDKGKVTADEYGPSSPTLDRVLEAGQTLSGVRSCTSSLRALADEAERDEDKNIHFVVMAYDGRYPGTIQFANASNNAEGKMMIEGMLSLHHRCAPVFARVLAMVLEGLQKMSGRAQADHAGDVGRAN